MQSSRCPATGSVDIFSQRTKCAAAAASPTCPLASPLCTHQELGARRCLLRFMTKLVAVRFAVSHTDHHGPRAHLPYLGHGTVGPQPLDALLLLEKEFLALRRLAGLRRVARLALYVDAP